MNALIGRSVRHWNSTVAVVQAVGFTTQQGFVLLVENASGAFEEWHSRNCDVVAAAPTAPTAPTAPVAAGTVLSQGELDGLTISPAIDAHGKVRRLEFTADTLPGLRLVVSAGAAAELRDALGVLLRRAEIGRIE